MAKQTNRISDELLAAFMDGKTTLEETQMVLDAAVSDVELQEFVRLSKQVDEDMESYTLVPQPTMRRLPMLERAAHNMVDNLCVVRCEGYALRALGIDVSDKELETTSVNNRWLQKEGVPLHYIGQLSGNYGLYVKRKYDCSLDDIMTDLKQGDVVIAVIDNTELKHSLKEAKRNDAELGEKPNHAVVIKSIDLNLKQIEIFDPETPNFTKVFPLDIFKDAWDDSCNYLVSISNQDDYEPHPLNLDDVPIEPELMELREAIAENAHEVWAKARKEEGWTYGTVRDDVKKRHPDLLPYNILPDSEKEYDRLMAMSTIKLVKKLGWDLVKRE